MCLGSKGGQQHRGLYSQEQRQESEGSSTFVRLHVDFSVQLLMPQFRKEITKLQQREIWGLEHLSCEERLK